MYPNIECNPAAYKHGVTENNIRRALWRHLFDGILPKMMMEARLMNELLCFHAVKCRTAFYPLRDSMET
jgi:hypothetical protein